jgi:hypothetical protein
MLLDVRVRPLMVTLFLSSRDWLLTMLSHLSEFSVLSRDTKFESLRVRLVFCFD